MDIPESLRETIALFRDSGRFYRNAEEMFGLVSWVEVMLGQRITCRRATTRSLTSLQRSEADQYIGHVERVIAGCVDAMPMHQAFIDRFCKAAP